jgi:hypothetical protein
VFAWQIQFDVPPIDNDTVVSKYSYMRDIRSSVEEMVRNAKKPPIGVTKARISILQSSLIACPKATGKIFN